MRCRIEASKRFYRAVFASLGLPDVIHEGQGFFHADELFVDKAEGYISRVHLAFQAANRDAVHAFHKAALAAGGRDNGAPGERSYHPGYYGAFVLDPDGNNIGPCSTARPFGPRRRSWSRQRLHRRDDCEAIGSGRATRSGVGRGHSGSRPISFVAADQL
jgi:hypothetical protein